MEIEGRILFFNTQSGNGTLILKSGEKSDFYVDVWDDFDSAPVSNLLVKCTIEDGIIKSIKTFNSKSSLVQGSFQGANNYSEDSDDQNNTFENTKVLEPQEEEEGATFSVSETLKNYFKPIDLIMGDPPKILNTEAKLDYFLAKRFLFTAYNNLKGIDPSLYENKEVKESSDLLHILDKAYYSVTDKIDIPSIAFEMIFLDQQPEYKQYLYNKEMCISRAFALGNVINSIFPEIEKKEAQLKKETNNKLKKQLEDKLKQLRGRYVDTIHEKATAKEELAAMADIKAIYTKRYFQTFKNELSLLKVEYKNMLTKILNYKAYELDELIWKHARTSKFVHGYFQNAGINGGYSTITYLRYYLKTLDKDKLKEEQEELFKLLKHLEK